MVRMTPHQASAVAWLLEHPDVWGWTDANLARALIQAGVYSPKTRVKDIRVRAIKFGVLDELGKPVRIYG